MTSGVKAGVFIRSYDGDAAWLRRTLPVNLKRLSGYDRVLVVGLPGESAEVQEICAENDVEFQYDFDAAWIPNGYLNQQYSKLQADVFMKGCEYILFVDSDCVALEENSPDIFFGESGKSMLMHTPWDKVGQADCWREPTAKALGRTPPYEFMRRLPYLYPTWLITATKRKIEEVHCCKLNNYLTMCGPFSEFNVLGAHAWFTHRDQFEWIDTEEDSLPYHPWKQCWSHGGMDEQLSEAENND